MTGQTYDKAVSPDAGVWVGENNFYVLVSLCGKNYSIGPSWRVWSLIPGTARAWLGDRFDYRQLPEWEEL